MTTLPDWMILSPDGITAAQYELMSEEICRRIEIVDGAVLVQGAPTRPHQRVVLTLASALEAACGPGSAVTHGVDLRLRDHTLLNRCPDIVVYNAGLPDEVVLRPEHCLLVVEVMSPGSVTADRLHKPAEYAAAGIGHFWRVEFNDAESKLTVFRYGLDPTTRTYASAGMHTGKMVVTDPLSVSVDLDDLL